MMTPRDAAACSAAHGCCLPAFGVLSQVDAADRYEAESDEDMREQEGGEGEDSAAEIPAEQD